MEKFYTGAIDDSPDKRDRPYEDYVLAVGALEIDWEKGYDIRNLLGGDIYIKNQKQSSSCVGQGWSYKVFVYQVIEMMAKYDMTLDELRIYHKEEIDEISAKAIYSQIFLPSGGAMIRSGGLLTTKWGAVFESLVPSLKDGKTTEEFMRDKTWLTEDISKIAEVLKGKECRLIDNRGKMDLFAQAIIQNHGVVGGVRGQNGRGWNTQRPKPPISTSDVDWGHCLYYGAFGTDEFGKFIATPNSWGKKSWDKDWKPGDKPGTGWQKLYQDYFVKEYQFPPWTYTDILNKKEPMTNAKLIRNTAGDGREHGIYLPIYSEDALISMFRNYGLEVPKKEDGKVDWDKLKADGETTIA